MSSDRSPPFCLHVCIALLASSACDSESADHASTDAAVWSSRAGAPVLKCKSFLPERQAFFGDLHVHTALSLDANLQGTRLHPVDAYRFARGERVDLPPYDAAGNATRSIILARALDFVAVSDHAEFLGLVTTCLTPDLPGYDSATCQSYRNMQRPHSSS
ncbi:MAG: hypothetical protein JWN04_6404 [Myxococcaceae bacterium]|nr:hypothetical protein [Myxococcaceae bacterium]